MKATAVVRHPCGAVDEIPITATPAEIDQLVLDGWEIWFRWSWQDSAALVAFMVTGFAMGAVAAGWTPWAW